MSLSSPSRIVFIGAGNMARAIISGLLKQGIPAQNITACEPSLEKLHDLAELGLEVSTDNVESAAKADLLILAVKPQIMKSVCTPLHAAVQARQPIIMSVAAGLTLDSFERWLGPNLAMVRCMPNTPSLIGKGASGLFANSHVQPEQKQLVEQVMTATGLALWVNTEDALDAVTAVSGSGPAYYFLMMEAMIKAGEALGLSEENAKALTLHTALGAAEMATSSDVSPAELRRRVTSPKGTTEQAILRFQDCQFEQIVEQAMQACHRRAKELAIELGNT